MYTRPIVHTRLATILFIGCSSLALACGEVDVAPDASIDASTDPVQLFCTGYQATCGFGNGLGGDTYTSFENCVDRFTSYNAARRDCTEEHLTFAELADPSTNCAAAEGGNPCDPRSTFCTQYSITCGFGNTLGGTPFTDTADCLARYDAFVASRQECVQLHLTFAESSPGVHCPHVAGEAPCN